MDLNQFTIITKRNNNPPHNIEINISYLISGNNTNNLVERQFKVILEEILGRTTAHSAGHLTSLLIQQYENNLKTKLLDSAHGRRCLVLKVELY